MYHVQRFIVGLMRQVIILTGISLLELFACSEAAASPDAFASRFEATVVVPGHARIDRTARFDQALFLSRPGGVGQTLDVFGERKALILLIGFPGVPNTYDPQEMHAGVFGPGQSTDQLYREASRDQMWLGGIRDPEGDVWGPYEVQTDGCSTLSYGEVSDMALAAAEEDGIDVNAYDHRIYAFPPVDSCPGGGIGGGNQVWVFGIGPQAIWDWVGHEAAHGFGFGHASSYDDCTVAGDPVTMGGACTHNEYGDPTDIMGRRNFQFSAWHMERAGWLAPENVAVVEASERITIAPLESASDQIQSVRVLRDNGEFFHFEYRQPVGFDAGLEPELTHGVLVRVVADPGSGGNPHLLDMTPQTSTNDDAALAVGRSFEDGNMRVTVIEANQDHAVIDVVLDGIPPDPDTGGTGTTGTGETGSEDSGAEDAVADETGGFGGTTGSGDSGADDAVAGETTDGSGSTRGPSDTGADGDAADEMDGAGSGSAADGSDTASSAAGETDDAGSMATGAGGCGCSSKPQPMRDSATLVLFALLALGAWVRSTRWCLDPEPRSRGAQATL